MLMDGVDAAIAAFEVGHESASEFNREYIPFFRAATNLAPGDGTELRDASELEAKAGNLFAVLPCEPIPPAAVIGMRV